jgi:hypothetical protein
MNRDDIIGELKEYLGDGVYASFDGWQIWLHTERESGHIERIALDPATFDALATYNKRLLELAKIQVERITGNTHDE